VRSWIHPVRIQSKGNKDRNVPLPKKTLELLREQWKTHKNKDWIFPSAGNGGNKHARCHNTSKQQQRSGRFSQALKSAGINKKATVHSSAAFLGHPPPGSRHQPAADSIWLGHSTPATTSVYTHLTEKAKTMAVKSINELMADL
jgi:integrase/recombinase XerD